MNPTGYREVPERGAGLVCSWTAALPAGADLPPLAWGRLDAERLTRAVDLIGLVKQVTARDHTRLQPGRLVFDAHLQVAWPPAGATAGKRPRRTASAASASPASTWQG